MLDSGKVDFTLYEVFVCAPEQKVKESIGRCKRFQKWDRYFSANCIDWSCLDPLTFQVLILKQADHDDQGHAVTNAVVHFYHGDWLCLGEIWDQNYTALLGIFGNDSVLLAGHVLTELIHGVNVIFYLCNFRSS